MRALATVLLATALAAASACASKQREAASCAGPAFAMNPGLWTPPAELPK